LFLKVGRKYKFSWSSVLRFMKKNKKMITLIIMINMQYIQKKRLPLWDSLYTI